MPGKDYLRFAVVILVFLRGACSKAPRLRRSGFCISSAFASELAPLLKCKNPSAIAEGPLCPGKDSNQHMIAHAATCTQRVN